MYIHRFLALCAATLSCLLLVLSGPQAAFAGQAPAAIQGQGRPVTLPPSITLGEARAIIGGAIAFARERNLHMAVIVLDTTGEVVSSDRMDGAPVSDMRFAQGKAFASLVMHQSTDALSEFAKTRPDRFFGILNMYPGQVYLVRGGEPLAVNGKLVGAIGVAGLPQGLDQMAGQAGVTAWEKYRAGPH